uniref:Uncharacterized protein n=1 Tax=Arundo donax TaxID=35708 RepID=A0A0A9D7P0_ARUDO
MWWTCPPGTPPTRRACSRTPSCASTSSRWHAPPSSSPSSARPCRAARRPFYRTLSPDFFLFFCPIGRRSMDPSSVRGSRF